MRNAHTYKSARRFTVRLLTLGLCLQPCAVAQRNQHPPLSGSSDRILWCGWRIPQELSYALFLRKIDGKWNGPDARQTESSEGDVLLATGPCNIAGFKGAILYIDGEKGRMLNSTKKTLREFDAVPGPIYYLGAWPPAYAKRHLAGHMVVLHAAHAMLFEKDMFAPTATLAKSPLARQQIALHRRDLFLIYINSHCVASREDAFDRFVDAAKQCGFDTPSSIGKCTAWPSHTSCTRTHAHTHTTNNHIYNIDMHR